MLPLDVTDSQEIRDAVAAAEGRFGGIDVLVNNAGRGWYGSVEGSPDADVRRSLELNFFSVVEALRAVLPGLRAHRSGWVVTRDRRSIRDLPLCAFHGATMKMD